MWCHVQGRWGSGCGIMYRVGGVVGVVLCNYMGGMGVVL